MIVLSACGTLQRISRHPPGRSNTQFRIAARGTLVSRLERSYIEWETHFSGFLLIISLNAGFSSCFSEGRLQINKRSSHRCGQPHPATGWPYAACFRPKKISMNPFKATTKWAATANSAATVAQCLHASIPAKRFGFSCLGHACSILEGWFWGENRVVDE